MGPHQVPDGALQGKPGTVPLALGPALVSPRGWRPMRTTGQGREADMRCPLPHADLHAWFDGALEPSQARRVQHHVAGCPACQRRLQLWTAIQAMLRAQAATHPAPPHVQEQIGRRLRQLERRRRRWWTAVAALAVVACLSILTAVYCRFTR
jgi:anti-sigma factor (TIGR02949 family)